MPSAGLPPLNVDPELCVVSRRSDSLGTRGRCVAFAAVAVVGVAVAVAWALAGAWVVLPYSAAELVVVAIAFRSAERRCRDWERLTVAGNCLVVERSRGGGRTRRVLERWRTRVEIGAGAAPRRVLHATGERVPFGDALPLAQRVATGKDLRRLTRLA